MTGTGKPTGHCHHARSAAVPTTAQSMPSVHNLERHARKRRVRRRAAAAVAAGLAAQQVFHACPLAAQGHLLADREAECPACLTSCCTRTSCCSDTPRSSLRSCCELALAPAGAQAASFNTADVATPCYSPDATTPRPHKLLPVPSGRVRGFQAQENRGRARCASSRLAEHRNCCGHVCP